MISRGGKGTYRIPRFNIFAEGPTADLARERDLLPEACNVAVNMALTLAGRFVIHVWAMEDHPSKLWQYVQDKHPRTRTIWGSSHYEEAWTARGYKPSQMYLRPSWALNREVSETGTVPVIPTLPVTIAKAVAHGAREIRVFGADMKGSGSPFRRWDRWVDAESESQARRWKNERRIFAQAVRRCEEAGCKLTRWKPTMAEAHETLV